MSIREWFYTKKGIPRKGPTIPIATTRLVGQARKFDGDLYVVFPGMGGSFIDTFPRNSEGRVIL